MANIISKMRKSWDSRNIRVKSILSNFTNNVSYKEKILNMAFFNRIINIMYKIV